MVEDLWDTRRAAFREAAAWFVQTTRSCKGRWDEVGLGDWSVRDLVGHTSRALLTIEDYLDQAHAPVTISSPAAYFASALASRGDPLAVAQRGRDAGAALGVDAVQSVVDIVGRILGRLDGERADAVATTPVGGMSLVEYLPTRTFELTVHTCDLAVALGLALEVPRSAAAESLTLAGQLAVLKGQGGDLLLAATGRRGLPSGFTVL